MRKETKIPALKENVGEAVEFIENALKTDSLDQTKIYKSTLVAEEILVQMIENADGAKNVITIRVQTGKKGSQIGISCKGTEWELKDLKTLRDEMKLSELEEEQSSIISQILIGAMSENIKLRHARGINYAQLNIRSDKAGHNGAMLLFMLLGIALGLLLRLLAPANFCSFVSDNIFSPGSTMFMNAIKMIVAPLVFFSIAESMTGFSDYKVFGRIGVKVIVLYFFTTAIAIVLSFAIFRIMRPGDPSQRSAVMTIAGMTQTQEASALTIRGFLTGIVPSNLAGAFLSGDMLQIIFVAMLIGVASGLLGEYSRPVQDFIKAANSLFTQVTNMILKLLPLATFCFMANTVLTTDANSITALAYVLLVIYVALLAMFLVYCLILAAAKISPTAFISGFRKAMMTAFTTASSNGAMPVSMKALDNMGVSPKVYSFSIPLGATINMDGASIGYVIMVLFMMRIFGINPDGTMLLSLFLSVMLLSIGTPGIPGSAIAMTAMLFTQFGIPAGAIGYVIPLIMLSDYGRTMSNVTGDAVVTAVVAKSENLLNIQMMRRKK